jgi:diguanylate cyclase (GGDEF)-like protein
MIAMENLESFVQQSSEWMALVDPQGQQLWSNRTLNDWLQSEAAPKNILELMREVEENSTHHSAIDLFDEASNSVIWTLQWILEGQKRQVAFRRQKHPSGWMLWALDQTKLLQQAEAWQHASTHDPTTGLYHRAFFDTEIRRLNRGRHFPISVFVIDIEGLKPINQILGPETGDRILSSTAQVLTQALRSDDVIARLGDDEFGLILPNTGAEGAQVVMNRLRHVLDATRISEGDLPWNAALGCATAEAPGQLQAMLAEADRRTEAEKLAHRRPRDPNG